MRHVIVLNQFALPRTEGGGTRHIDLFGRLPGWQALIIAGDRNHYSQRQYRTTDQRFRLVHVPQQRGKLSRVGGWLLYSVRAFISTIARRQLDLVYGSSPHLLAPLAGLVAARIRGVPFVLEIRDLWPESLIDAGQLRQDSLLHRVFSWMEKLVVRQADAVVGVTPGWEEHLAGVGMKVASLTIIPNGTELSDFQTDNSRDDLREIHSIRGCTAIFTGAHGPKDGIDLILDACKQVPEVNFLLVGEGRAKEAARMRAADEGISNIEFRDPVSKQDLPELLAGCDIGIHAVTPLSVFQKGMSPNKLFDYLAAGLPVVSNAGEALRSITADTEYGHIGGPDSLADGVRAVSRASSAQRATWAGNGRALIAGPYSRSHAAHKLAQTLESLLSTRA